MQSIITKYLPATNTLGARIKATASGCNKSVTIPFPYEYTNDRAHWEAARILLGQLPWQDVNWYAGEIKSGYVFAPHSRAFNTWHCAD